ncbi:hypothetical protein [Streptomyces sp. NPDC127066]|uniref:hypothetical protein n=1 Tax=Streptomyces sp. NPDC127066 TaxID=3347125 RepID=UPI003648440B
MNLPRRQFAFAATVVSAVLFLTGCSSDSNDSKPDKPDRVDAGPSSRDVAITKQGFEDSAVYGDHTWIVHYSVTNSGTDRADYFVKVSLADKDGKQIGTSSAVTTGVRPGVSTEERIVPVAKDMSGGDTADIGTATVTGVERVPTP